MKFSESHQRKTTGPVKALNRNVSMRMCHSRDRESLCATKSVTSSGKPGFKTLSMQTRLQEKNIEKMEPTSSSTKGGSLTGKLRNATMAAPRSVPTNRARSDSQRLGRSDTPESPANVAPTALRVRKSHRAVISRRGLVQNHSRMDSQRFLDTDAEDGSAGESASQSP